MNKIDLHIHSNYSLDGEKTPNELLDIALNSNIEYIAIADHNSCEAYDHIPNSKVHLIPAIEIDCIFQNKVFHVLAYFINPHDIFFKQLQQEISNMELHAGLHYLSYTQQQMGIIVDIDYLNTIHPNGIYTAEGICEASLINEVNKTNPYLKEYFPGGEHSISPNVDFFWEYCAQDKIAHTPIHFRCMENIITEMRKHDAFIVLAHPGNNTKEDLPLLEGIVNLGIDGIEVYSSYHTPTQIEFYKQFASKHNLVMTCGSDYHGKHKPHISMGDCHMPKEDEQALINFITNKKQACN